MGSVTNEWLEVRAERSHFVLQGEVGTEPGSEERGQDGMGFPTESSHEQRHSQSVWLQGKFQGFTQKDSGRRAWNFRVYSRGKEEFACSVSVPGETLGRGVTC